MTSTASTYTEAIKLSEPVTLHEAIRRLTEDDNPKIYRYRKTARIAMDAMVHGHGTRWVFVGFDYCNRNGHGRTDGVANFHSWYPHYKPTVFQSDRFGYFHVTKDEFDRAN